MKFLLAALLGCLYVACASASKLADKEGFYYDPRPRLGHFKVEPYIDLYKIYAAAFVLPENPGRDPDDNRNYLPSADECVTFLKSYRKRYQLKDIEEFIKLDACLGYLFESPYHEKDSAHSATVASDLPALVNDEKLKTIYQGTQVDHFQDNARNCLGDLFLNAVRAKKQYPTVVCNNEWINLFNAFAECQKDSELTSLRNMDEYLKIVYELVKRRGTECFHNEIRTLDEAIRGTYVNSPLERVGNILKAPFSSIRSQAKDRIWNHKLTELLAAVQGTTGKVNLREVNLVIRGINEEHPAIKKKLLENLASYADRTINPKKDKKTQADPNGVTRYSDLVDNLCNFFRQNDLQGYYDYVTPFVRMLRMLEYPDIFGLDKEYFLKHVLIGGYETAPLYLSICSCNIISETEGEIIVVPQNGPLHYQVDYKVDTTALVKWPDAGYY